MKNNSNKNIITRFPPSPTGLFHIGSARTALFNYLYAKQNNGKFILRIEDTDRERSKIEYEKDIIDSLSWLGITWDNEKIERQSERGDVYKNYLEKLLKDKKAYHCFCSKDELEAMRQEQMSRGETPKYNGACSRLSDAEVAKKISEGKKFVIRLRAEAKKISFNDLIRGEIEFDTGLLGDFVIAKNLEEPLYNFTVVIDDAEAGITHIVRGEDHISNTPKQILVMEALEIAPPYYAHLPLILGPDRSKMSKRHGAASVAEYKNQGYLKEALINFVAFLGWNPGTDKEIYSLAELVKDFNLEKIQKGGAIFNIERLNYLNGVYIRNKPIKELVELCKPFLKESGYEIDENILEKVVVINQGRMKKLSDICDLAKYFSKNDLNYEKELLKWKDAADGELKLIFGRLVDILENVEEGDWQEKQLEKLLLEKANEIAIEIKGKADRGYVLWPLRVALSGEKNSAGPFEIAGILGKEKTIKRIQDAVKKLS